LRHPAVQFYPLPSALSIAIAATAICCATIIDLNPPYLYAIPSDTALDTTFAIAGTDAILGNDGALKAVVLRVTLC